MRRHVALPAVRNGQAPLREGHHVPEEAPLQLGGPEDLPEDAQVAQVGKEGFAASRRYLHRDVLAPMTLFRCRNHGEAAEVPLFRDM